VLGTYACLNKRRAFILAVRRERKKGIQLKQPDSLIMIVMHGYAQSGMSMRSANTLSSA
jgi:hypothetical protein